MRYELYLRVREPTAEAAQQLREGILAEPDLVAEGSAPRELRFETGIIAVQLHPAEVERWAAPDPEAPLGVDLAVEAGAGEALATQLVERACAWAKRWSLVLYDPQLGRTVRPDEPRDLETVTRRIKQQSDYLTDTVGLGDGPSSYVDVDHDAPLLSWRARFYIFGAALLLLLAMLAHYCR